MSTRPILKLPFREAPPPPPPPPPMWLCKPCGAQFSLPEGPEDTVVRCPSCNAKLGKLAAFNPTDGSAPKVRARLAPVA